MRSSWAAINITRGAIAPLVMFSDPIGLSIRADDEGDGTFTDGKASCLENAVSGEGVGIGAGEEVKAVEAWQDLEGVDPRPLQAHRDGKAIVAADAQVGWCIRSGERQLEIDHLAAVQGQAGGPVLGDAHFSAVS